MTNLVFGMIRPICYCQCQVGVSENHLQGMWESLTKLSNGLRSQSSNKTYSKCYNAGASCATVGNRGLTWPSSRIEYAKTVLIKASNEFSISHIPHAPSQPRCATSTRIASNRHHVVRPRPTPPRYQVPQDGHVESRMLSQFLVTDQTSRCKELVSASFDTSVTNAETFTVPLGNTSPSHSSDQDRELWQNKRRGVGLNGFSNSPLSGSPSCIPKIIEPGLGESRPARARARRTCASFGNR